MMCVFALMAQIYTLQNLHQNYHPLKIIKQQRSIGNAVSKCAFYCSPNCVSASVRKRYTIHIITANYWHYTSGTLVNQNAHLLTLPTIKYGSEIKIPGKCFFVVQVLLFLLRPEILRVCSGQLEQFRLERAIMGSDFVKNFMTYITVMISELQRNCEKK